MLPIIHHSQLVLLLLLAFSPEAFHWYHRYLLTMNNNPNPPGQPGSINLKPNKPDIFDGKREFLTVNTWICTIDQYLTMAQLNIPNAPRTDETNIIFSHLTWRELFDHGGSLWSKQHRHLLHGSNSRLPSPDN